MAGAVRVPGFVRGVGHGLNGVRMVIMTPRLWPWVLLPFVISVAAFAGIFALVVNHFGWGWALIVPVVGIFLFLPVASLIAAPFNETIAETVEQKITGREPPPFSLKRLFRDLGLGLAHEVRKLLRWMLLSAAVLALSLLVPVVGTIIGVAGGFYVAARFAAYDALDATFSRWGWSYAEKVGFVRKHRAFAMGLGAVVALLLMVPGLNAVAMPLGAAGGALAANRVAGGPGPPQG